MFCTKCGKQLPDGMTVCEDCAKATQTAKEPASGANTENYSANSNDAYANAKMANYAEQAATVQEPRIPTTSDGHPVGNLLYLFKYARPEVKIWNYIATALGVFCIIWAIIACTRFVSGSVFKNPLVKLASLDGGMFGAEEDLERIREGLEAVVDGDMSEKRFEEKYGFDIDELEDETGMDVEELLKYISPLSLKNMMKLVDDYGQDVPDEYVLFKIFIGVVRAWTAILAVLTALAVVFKQTWLVILTYISAFSFFLLTGGFIFWLIGSVAFIALAVFVSKVKKEYKYYCKSVIA